MSTPANGGTPINGVVHQEAPEVASWNAIRQTLTAAPAQEPELISIPFMDYEETEVDGTVGKKILKRKPVMRTLEIYTFVPTQVLQKLLQEVEHMPPELLKLRPNQKVPLSLFKEESMTWVYRQVLNVVHLYEPAMTLEQLMQGVEFIPMLNLFAQCFVGPLSQLSTAKGNQAQQADNQAQQADQGDASPA